MPCDPSIRPSAAPSTGRRRAAAARGDGDVRAANYWLYAVWLTIYAVVFAALGQEDFPHAVDGLGAALAQAVVSATTLWFVLALACYPLALTGLRAAGASPVTVLAVATLLWVVGSYAVLPGFTGKVAENFLFFVLGVHGAAHLWRWADGGWRPTAAFCGLFLVSVGLVTVVPDALVVPAVLLSSLAGIPASVVVIALCCRLPSVARAGNALGSRTLPVYLMHPCCWPCGRSSPTTGWLRSPAPPPATRSTPLC